MSYRSDWSDGSRHSRWGRQHQDEGACMKINLPIFKDEDAKDAVTYQSWRWDLTVYQCAGCRDCTLLPYAIRSLQGYPGELVWSSGMHITLDDVLMILDEHYNNVKALDVLKQELFQLQMADKETVLDWGIHLSRHFQVLAVSFPDHFCPRSCGRVAEILLLQQTSQAIKSDGNLPEGGSTGEDILRLPKGCQGGWEGRFYGVAPKLQNPNCWWPPNQGLLASSLWGNLRATSHFWKICCPLSTFGGRGCKDSEDPESDDPGGIEGVTKEFMVQLAKAVKDAQADEKQCYHCNSPEHFTCNWPFVKISRDKKQLNGKEGTASMKGAWTPPITMSAANSPKTEAPEA